MKRTLYSFSKFQFYRTCNCNASELLYFFVRAIRRIPSDLLAAIFNSLTSCEIILRWVYAQKRDKHLIRCIPRLIFICFSELDDPNFLLNHFLKSITACDESFSYVSFTPHSNSIQHLNLNAHCNFVF